MTRRTGSMARSANSPVGLAMLAGIAFLTFTCITGEPAQLALLGFLVSFCAAFLFGESQERKAARKELHDVLTALPVPFALAKEPGFFLSYESIAASLTTIVQHRDQLFLELVRHRIESMVSNVATLAKGEIVFDATETCAQAYQRSARNNAREILLLRCLGAQQRILE